MASTFIDYEKVNNPFMASLLKEEFPVPVAKISSLGGTILIPQAMAFDDPVASCKQFKITKDFIRDHTVIFDPRRPLNFVTLSGYLGKCTTDDPYEKNPSGFYLFDRISLDKLNSFIDTYNNVIIPSQQSMFFDSILTLFKDAEKVEESKRSVNYIMRNGVLVVGSKSLPFFIVPEILPPISDNYMLAGTSLDDSAVPINSSSFAAPVSNDGDENEGEKDKSADDDDDDKKEGENNNGGGESEKEFAKQSERIKDFFQKLRLSDAVDIRNSLNK